MYIPPGLVLKRFNLVNDQTASIVIYGLHPSIQIRLYFVCTLNTIQFPFTMLLFENKISPIQNISHNFRISSKMAEKSRREQKKNHFFFSHKSIIIVVNCLILYASIKTLSYFLEFLFFRIHIFRIELLDDNPTGRQCLFYMHSLFQISAHRSNSDFKKSLPHAPKPWRKNTQNSNLCTSQSLVRIKLKTKTIAEVFQCVVCYVDIHILLLLQFHWGRCCCCCWCWCCCRFPLPFIWYPEHDIDYGRHHIRWIRAYIWKYSVELS